MSKSKNLLNLKVDEIQYFDYGKKEIELAKKYMLEDNIPAFFTTILHNQAVILGRIKEILEYYENKETKED